jgi:hypothetical protein
VRGRLLLSTWIALGLLALGAAGHALAVGDRAAAQQPPGGPAPAPQRLLLRVGDTVRVQGAGLGCQVARQNGRVTIECRRTGDVKGTYGTFLDERAAIVARFRSPATAQVVFDARHGGDWKACRTPVRRTRAAQSSTTGLQCR